MDTIRQVHALQQSVWYDNIQRRLLEDGELENLIRSGAIRGITSNPTIFHNAIANTRDYDTALQSMSWAGWSAEEMFYHLAIEDIQAAADLFFPLYQQTQGEDGYVSLEVNPLFAYDTEKTIREAKRLWALVNRPNLMIKIPATNEGIPAIRQAITAGINVNVTLIFSLERYQQVLDAHTTGLEARLRAGLPIHQIASVASFFVSRLDTKVDRQLNDLLINDTSLSSVITPLLGSTAIANARLAYQVFKRHIASGKFSRLLEQGGLVQRPLWASTSTKNPAYRDVMYVEELIGAESVNTIPPQTLDAFIDHGMVRGLTIEQDTKKSENIFNMLENLGISIAEITQTLEQEGVKAFLDSHQALIQAIESKRLKYLMELGSLADTVAIRVDDLETQRISQRLYDKDPTIWTHDSEQSQLITRRLGWLEAPAKIISSLEEIHSFIDDITSEGYTKCLLLGMGGSSLAPEVFAYTFPRSHAGLELKILDSTDPTQVSDAEKWAAIEQTLFIVSSKSGGTSEVNAFLSYFWEKAINRLGNEEAPRHFIAITDPGTSLEKVALERGFKKIFHGDPTIGGRYSALTVFGLVPAALIGMDIARLLNRTCSMMKNTSPNLPVARNPGLALGAFLSEAALQGRDKMTILADPEIASIGSWIEQLVAESSGKKGVGIIPIDEEPVQSPEKFQNDRIFIYISVSGKLQDRVEKIRQAGHPIITISLNDLYDLGAEFFRWGLATSIACSILGVNAFDQPDVQDNKDRTIQKIQEIQQTGSLFEGDSIWENAQAKIFGKPFSGLEEARTLTDAIRCFLRLASQGDYIAINAYLPRNEDTTRQLQSFRLAVVAATQNATTLGFGPRFLHSTGQLHKGGANNGIFIQITRDASIDLPIPGQGITFAQLERAQALGDLEALQARDRRVIRIHLKGQEALVTDF